MRWLVLIAMLLMSGCGVGYVLPHGMTRPEFQSASDMDAATKAISARLLAMGFHREPQQPEMPGLDDDLPPSAKDMLLRQRKWLRFGRDDDPPTEEGLDITLDACAEEPCTRWSNAIEAGIEPHPPMLTLNVAQSRPGGFTPNGLRTYDEIQAFLSTEGYKAITVTTPPVDEKEHDRIQRTNLISGISCWLVAWTIFAAVILMLANWALWAAKVALAPRRLVLVVIGVVAATPVPMPWMFGVVVVPNLLLLPFMYDYGEIWGRAWAPMLAMFGASLVLSFAAVMLIMRKPKAPLTAESE